MRILYFCDVMGPMGVAVVEKVLPELYVAESVDVVIAQAENVTAGKGLSVADYEKLRAVGVDGFTGGNWTTHLKDTLNLLSDPSIPVVGPANMQGCTDP